MSNSKSKYQLAQCPVNRELRPWVDAVGDTVEEVQRWAQGRVDLNSRWIIKEGFSNVGDVTNITLYKGCSNRKGYQEKIFYSRKGQESLGWFLTIEAARRSYLAHKVLADKRLKGAAQALMDLEEKYGCTIDYMIDGDTHGIYEDFMYIQLTEGPYEFSLRLGD